jgi:Animal haem peroxidase
MRTHGGTSQGCPFAHARGEPFSASTLPRLAGFRHFLGDPAPHERFLVDGEDPRSSATAFATLRRRLRGLALLMGQRPAEAPDNPDLPAGYTYTLQFLAHDLVMSSLPLWAAHGGGPAVENLRGRMLRLDTLYGPGPTGCPFPYAPDDPQDFSRSRFRLSPAGPFSPKASCGPGEYRDIGRAKVQGTSGGMGGHAEALVADSRNDQHSLISQATTLFQMLHNALVEMQPAPSTRFMGERIRGHNLRFAAAREATTLIWRHLIRTDILPRILHPAVRALYAGPAPALLEPGAPSGVTLEFSHGAFRFGHAMARDSYHFGEAEEPLALGATLRQSSARSPELMPLRRIWIAQWSRFFPLPGQQRPNLSKRIGPQFSGNFVTDGLFDPIESGDPWGLAYRDLLSASLAGLRSLDSLAAEVLRRRRWLAAASPMLADRAARQQALIGWLGCRPKLSRLGANDIAALAVDPPLPFYVMFEAEQEADGRHLGVLGSLIVAETLHGALARDPLPTAVGGGDLATQLDRLCAAWLGEFRFRPLPTFDDMAGLVGFLARHYRLENADPPFI